MKKELAMKKKHAIKILLNPKSWIATEDKSRMVTRWTYEEEFECESDTECFTTEDLSEAVNWLYAEQDPYRKESKPNLDETYKLEAKDDEEQSKLAEIMTEATREARLDVLEAIKTFCYSACESTHNKTKKRAYHEVIDLIKSLRKVVDNQ